MLVLSWVKETAEFVRYEALFLVHPFVNNFHKYCTLPGHCACRYAIDLLPNYGPGTSKRYRKPVTTGNTVISNCEKRNFRRSSDLAG